MPADRDLLDLVGLLGEGFAVALDELHAIDDVEAREWLDWPDDVRAIFAEHAAMKATLARIRAAASDAVQRRIVATYRDAKAKTPPTAVESSPATVPVLDEVTEALDRVGESLRRLYLTSAPVRAALDEVPGGWRP